MKIILLSTFLISGCESKTISTSEFVTSSTLNSNITSSENSSVTSSLVSTSIIYGEKMSYEDWQLTFEEIRIPSNDYYLHVSTFVDAIYQGEVWVIKKSSSYQYKTITPDYYFDDIYYHDEAENDWYYFFNETEGLERTHLHDIELLTISNSFSLQYQIQTYTLSYLFKEEAYYNTMKVINDQYCQLTSYDTIISDFPFTIKDTKISATGNQINKIECELISINDGVEEKGLYEISLVDIPAIKIPSGYQMVYLGVRYPHL